MVGIPCGNFFEKEPDNEQTPTPSSYSFLSKTNPAFFRLALLVACTIVVFVLLISGTATTAISFPPQPLRYVRKSSTDSLEDDEITIQPVRKEDIHTALDGDFKLIGPLLLTAGCFLLVINVALCVIVTREAYHNSRMVRPNASLNSMAMPVWGGGPFYLTPANPIPIGHHPNSAPIPFSFSKQLWNIPNAPTPDFSLAGTSRGGKIRPASASLIRDQPPFNPDIDAPECDS
ncbi:uncharacterized protein LOC129217325 [Uloborus diversus]|uniref:uncharacterized protein LOC129217325 n=1 Tax=Uloborus diversus TaxID=327109 RepID=UPI0024090D6B|nr:uncharacterized protein LOC129217325 [Uloborus diversus]XP_054707581.1 uncharacterized protein LOC129217325 [Uloborus diversus]